MKELLSKLEVQNLRGTNCIKKRPPGRKAGMSVENKKSQNSSVDFQ